MFCVGDRKALQAEETAGVKALKEKALDKFKE